MDYIILGIGIIIMGLGALFPYPNIERSWWKVIIGGAMIIIGTFMPPVVQSIFGF